MNLELISTDCIDALLVDADREVVRLQNYWYSETVFEEALREAESKGEKGQILIEKLDNLARVYEMLGRYDEAEALYTRALKSYLFEVTPKDGGFFRFLVRFASLMDKSQKWDMAQAFRTCSELLDCPCVKFRMKEIFGGFFHPGPSAMVHVA